MRVLVEVLMVRGCQKKIIYLKNTQSDIFDEAYFVIKDNSLYEQLSECNMVEEANRILKESFDFEENESLNGKIGLFVKRYLIPFLLGIILGILITVIL